ncbi:GntR family transcriptional regulator [soil metagenome]
MNHAPIAARPYLRDEVYAALKLRLGERAAGIDAPVRVREEALAAELGVSRTPVREAMRRLEQEGLVSFRPRRGARLMPTSLPEYLEWLSIREMLEGLAAREVATSGTADVGERLRAVFAGFDEAGALARPAEYAEANSAFHALLIRESRNLLLDKTWQSFGHLKMAGLRFIERLNRGAQSFHEHGDIIDAIAARDPDRAELLARLHVRLLRDQARTSLTEFNSETHDGIKK